MFFFDTDSFLKQKLVKNGIDIHVIELSNKLKFPLNLFLIFRLMRSLRPDILQTWMYHSDLLGGMIAKLVGIKIVIWNIRNSNILDYGISKSTKLIAKLSAILSEIIPTKIICVSQKGYNVHAELGYCKQKLVVIENGVDCSLYKKNDKPSIKRQKKLNEFLANYKFIVCSIGRVNYYKDYQTLSLLINLAEKIAPQIGFVVVGKGVSDLPRKYEELADVRNVCLLEEYEKPVEVYSMSDVFCLHSRSEGHPNVLLEAMSVGLPCVTTDVGDAGNILSDPNNVVKVGDYEALLKSIVYFFNMEPEERKNLGLRNRRRIQEVFSLERMVFAYDQLYNSLLENK